MRYNIFLFIIFFSTISCNNITQEQITGKWIPLASNCDESGECDKIIRKNNQIVEFTEDGMFKTGNESIEFLIEDEKIIIPVTSKSDAYLLRIIYRKKEIMLIEITDRAGKCSLEKWQLIN